MRKNRFRVALIASALVSTTAPAWGQDAADRGKTLVDAQCNSCHALTARVGSGYTKEGWNTVMRMMTNHGVKLSAEDVPAMTAYLVKTFPVKPRPPAVLIPGPTKVTMKAWQAATPGARPHDPLAAKDGSLWYTGQMVNALGRVDPKALPDNARRPRAVLDRLDPAQDQFGPRLSDGQGAHTPYIGCSARALTNMREPSLIILGS